MLRPRLIGGDERQVDIRLHHRRQLHLCLLGRFLETLQRHGILGQIDSLIPLELPNQPLHDTGVEIVAAQVCVAVGALDLEDSLSQLENRDVVGPAAEVVDGDFLFLLLIETVGESRGGRLVDDPDHVETGDLAGVLGRLALRIVEIGRDRDHGLLDFMAEIVLRRLPHLLEDHRRDLRRRVGLAHHFNGREPVLAARNLIGDALDLFADLFEAPSHEPFYGEDRVLRVGHRLPFGHLPNESLTVFCEGDHRWGGSAAFGVGDDDGIATFHDRYDGVGRPEVNADDLLSHTFSSW